jgi:hypothetical protein
MTGRSTLKLTAATISKLRRDAEKLERLAADLRRIADGVEPPPEELEKAPVIDGWVVGQTTHLCLVGRVKGHPEIPDTHLTRTSDLWFIDYKARWARTLSRFYKLGDEDIPRPECLN